MDKKWWTLIAVGCGTFMATLDASIVNVALPTLSKTFQAELDQIKWVVIIYYLLITCLVLPFGMFSDLIGRKKTFMGGFSVFIFGSLFCGMSNSLVELLVSRGIQAIGAAWMMTNGPAIITQTFPGRERGRALGLLAMAVSLGLVTGPSLGGFLLAFWSWKEIFYVNLPVGIFGLILVYIFIPNDIKGKPQKGSFDWAGSIMQILILLLLIVIFEPPNISISGSLPYPIPRGILVALTLFFIGIFFELESNAKNPICDLNLIKNRSFWTANLAGFLIFVAYSSITVLMPFFLQDLLQIPLEKIGVMMSVIPLAIFISAPISGRLSDHYGSRELTLFASCLAATGLFVLAGVFGGGVSAGITKFEILLTFFITGISLGVFQSPNNNSIMGSVPTDKLGTASGMVATLRNLGVMVGTGLAAGIFQWRRQVTSDFEQSLRFTFLICGFVALLAALAALGTKKGPHWKNEHELV